MISKSPINTTPDRFWTVFTRYQFPAKDIVATQVVSSVRLYRDAQSHDHWDEVIAAVEDARSDLISVIETSLKHGVKDVTELAIDEACDRYELDPFIVRQHIAAAAAKAGAA